MIDEDPTTFVDTLVLGAGPGGYVSALRLAQLGRSVVLVDPGPPGGTCLYSGCIPSRALLSVADRAWQVPRLSSMGILVSDTKVDLLRMHAWKDEIVTRLSSGVRQLLERRRVTVLRGMATFLNPSEVLVKSAYSLHRFRFSRCIIAVGVEPMPLAALPFDGWRVLSPAEALQLTSLPTDLAVIGAGYMAAEMATFFAKLGIAVRLLVPAGQRLLPEFDPIAGRLVLSRLRRLDVRVEPECPDPATSVNSAAMVVVAIGQRPRTVGLNLTAARVITDSDGFINVGNGMVTNNGSIFAVGDVTGGSLLATAAIRQGKIAAETIAGLTPRYNPRTVPRVAWTDPEVAAVGLTAAEASAIGYTVVSGRFPLAANGRALTLGSEEGMVLTVADRESGAVLGVTIVGQRAGELIGEAALGLELGATLNDLARTLHPHPGLSETLQESAEMALGTAVHIFRI